MITLRRSDERGHVDPGWLDARHTFSFADCLDPAQVPFGPLRVLNQDRVAPGRGFGMHPHRDMEIVTWVLEGSLRHADSMGNGSIVRSGEAQFMSAGPGVLHSEHNASSSEPPHLLQLWVLPRGQGSAPRYDQRVFPAAERADRLRLVLSPDGREGSIRIGQDVALRAATFAPGARIAHELEPGRGAWLHLASGSLRLGDRTLGPGDGAGIRGERALQLEGLEPVELVLWELP